jgi:hypothetical protein
VDTKEQDKGSTNPWRNSLADVALLDAASCALVGGMSVSWWYEELRAGRAPAPVIRQPRCTRWRLRDVYAFWQERAERAIDGDPRAQAVVVQATRASQVSRSKRAVKAAKVVEGQCDD